MILANIYLYIGTKYLNKCDDSKIIIMILILICQSCDLIVCVSNQHANFKKK